jgi:hypothetical protein
MAQTFVQYLDHQKDDSEPLNEVAASCPTVSSVGALLLRHGMEHP